MIEEKRPAIGLMVLSLAMSPLLQAEESAPVTANPEQVAPISPMEGMMSDEQLKKQQQHLLKMQDLSNRILGARDSKEKQRLIDEQLNLMREHQLQHHQMMHQHMQEMMKNKAGMPMMPATPCTEMPQAPIVTPK